MWSLDVSDRVKRYQDRLFSFKRFLYDVAQFLRIALDRQAIFLPMEGGSVKRTLTLSGSMAPDVARYLPLA